MAPLFVVGHVSLGYAPPVRRLAPLPFFIGGHAPSPQPLFGLSPPLTPSQGFSRPPPSGRQKRACRLSGSRGERNGGKHLLSDGISDVFLYQNLLTPKSRSTRSLPAGSLPIRYPVSFSTSKTQKCNEENVIHSRVACLNRTNSWLRKISCHFFTVSALPPLARDQEPA